MQSKQIALVVLLIFGFLFSAQAQFRLPKILGSNMVLQRDQPTKIWGWAKPGTTVEVVFDGKSYKGQTNTNEEWSVQLPATEAGGPYDLVIKSGGESKELSNILFGDVWVCSGQSNMEWPVSSANNPKVEIAAADYPEIRLFNVPNKIATIPQSDLEGGEWSACSPKSIAGFSAVGYFFGRDLHKTLDIPIGLIGSNWGGTVVETWISKDGLSVEPEMMQEAEKVGAPEFQEEVAKADEKQKAWLASFQSGDKGMKGDQYIWADPKTDFGSWKDITLPALWENAEIGELKDYDGVVWFAKTINLKEDVGDKAGILNLGPVDDTDNTWVNGIAVGSTYNQYNVPREYAIPAGTLKPGKNTIVVRVEDYQGGGGIFADLANFNLLVGSDIIELGGEWKYKIGLAPVSAEGRPRGFGPNSYPTLLYNGMIHPIIQYSIKGAIWYQGESNASRAYQYRRLFPALIKNWRSKWQVGEFPFYFVQLANFMAPVDQPQASDWAELREAQDMTLSLYNTGMASAIDIGEADDIHPRNKQEVGRRLALAAKK